MIIYKATNKINGKVYIGQTTKTLEYRRKQHERDAMCIYKPSLYFHNALMKYGFENFLWEIIDTAESQEELDEKEIKWISICNSTNHNKGYNLKLGGNGGGKCTERTIQKLKESTTNLMKNPEFKKRCLAGLRKGTESMKRKAEINFKTTYCVFCGKEITYRPIDYNGNYPRFCSEECRLQSYKRSCIAGVEAAAKVTKEKGEIEQLRIKNCVLDWIKTKPQILKGHIKYNSLSSICSILTYITNVKDMRTIMKPFDFTSRKEFVKYLLKIYAEQV